MSLTTDSRSARTDRSATIGLRRHFTTAGSDPYSAVEWERRDSVITNWRDGSVVF